MPRSSPFTIVGDVAAGTVSDAGYTAVPTITTGTPAAIAALNGTRSRAPSALRDAVTFPGP